MIERETFRRRDLPHWDVPGAVYFVTACLRDSIPAKGLLDIRDYTASLNERTRPEELSVEDWETRKWKLRFARTDRWLDCESAARHLAEPALAAAVVDTLLHFEGNRYDVIAYAVMPSHFHWVFRPRAEWVAGLAGEQSPRERIMRGAKGYAARQCNALLGRAGPFWQDESYDHWTRDLGELERIVWYVENNPVAAGLVGRPEDWLYSSASRRIGPKIG